MNDMRRQLYVDPGKRVPETENNKGKGGLLKQDVLVLKVLKVL